MPQARLSEGTFYNSKAKVGGMTMSEAKRLTALEDENAKLRNILAEQARCRDAVSAFWRKRPIGRHLKSLFEQKRLWGRLRTVHENPMAGALRIRARAGDGVAWLPGSMAAPDLGRGQLVRAGPADWDVGPETRLFRDTRRTNRLTRSLWSFLGLRQSVSLLEGV